jgi:hypothetical protein
LLFVGGGSNLNFDDVFVLINASAGFKLMAVGWRSMAARVAWEMMRETTYAARTLGKIPISPGWSRQQTVPMVYVCYGGRVIGLLLLAGWRKEPKSSELRIGRFLEVFGLILI